MQNEGEIASTLYHFLAYVCFVYLLFKEKTKALENEGVPDDEGWITVTRHSKKNKPTPRTEAMEAKLTDKEKKKKTNMVRNDLNFTEQFENVKNLICEMVEEKQEIFVMYKYPDFI